MKVLILAAGYAVRLQPLTLSTPKPLLEIGGKKLLDRIFDKVAALKERVEGVYIITNEKFFEKFQEWLKGCKIPFEIIIINDGSVSNETRLGAVKDMAMAIETAEIEGDLLVIAGDNLFDFDLKDLLSFAASHPDKVIVALHDIGDPESAKRFGVVAVDKGYRVVGFAEKPEKPKSTLISTGIYYFPKSRLGLIEEYMAKGGKLDAPGYYIKWLSEKEDVYGFVFDEGWYDIGDINSFEAADRRYKKEGK